MKTRQQMFLQKINAKLLTSRPDTRCRRSVNVRPTTTWCKRGKWMLTQLPWLPRMTSIVSKGPVSIHYNNWMNYAVDC